MEISSAAKVGIITMIAIIILALIVSQLGQWKGKEKGDEYYIVFDQVGGLHQGNEVRLSGVDIGKVKEITIRSDGKVQADILVTYKGIVLYTNFLYTVSSTVWGESWLEITRREGGKRILPNDRNMMVAGTSPVIFTEVMRQGKKALDDLQKAVASINDMVSDPNVKTSVKETIANFGVMSGNLKNASATLSATLENISSKISSAADNANELMIGLKRNTGLVGKDLVAFSKSIKRIAVSNEGDLRVIVKNLKETSENLGIAMKSIKELVSKNQFSDDLLQTLDHIRKTAETVETIAKDIQSVTSDPQVKEDVKVTIHEARKTVEGAKKLIENINGPISGEPGKKKLVSVEAEVEWAQANGTSSANLNMFLLPGSPTYLKFGVDNVGHGSFANLQLGKRGKNFGGRAGVVRSNFGIGLDAFLLKDNFRFSVDAYDPRNVKVDLIGRWNLIDDFFIMGGTRDTFNNRTTVFGVGKRF